MPPSKTVLRGTAREILDPLQVWAQQCHAASVRLCQSGEFGVCRVARGACSGVGGQHSWLILSDDVYDRSATIIDGTLWSYDKDVDGIWVGSMRDGRHRPKGMGSIWNFGRPPGAREMGEEPMELTPRNPWSGEAREFLAMLGPMGEQGWIKLAHFPMEGWPSAEIIDAICESGLEGYVPIDIVGMLTDRKPELYLPTQEKEV